MKLKNLFRPVLYAALLMLPTYYGMRSEYFLLFIVAVLIGERSLLKSWFGNLVKQPFNREFLPFWIVFLIVSFSFVNKTLNGHSILCLSDYYAGFYLLPFLFLTANLLRNDEFLKVLVILTVIEVLFAIVEYVSGYRTFFWSDASTGISDYNLLYNSRVYGLSANSSILAYKVFLAFLLIDLIRLKNYLEWIFRGALLIGLILSFGRSVIFVLLIYWLVKIIVAFFKEGMNGIKKTSIQFSLLVVLFTGLLISPLRYQLSRGDKQAETTRGLEVKEFKGVKNCAEQHALPMQVGQSDPSKQGLGDRIFAGKSGLQTSGRKQIWLNYVNFIEAHLWFGNGSDKLLFLSWDKLNERYKLVHAHNSFIQLLATNGILIFILYFFFYGYYLRRSNLLPVLAIAVYSAMNYGIFWGFSYMDLIFLCLLMNNFSLKHDYQTKG